MKTARTILMVLVLLPVLLLVLLNVFLNIGLPRLLNQDGGPMRVEYSAAWMLVPGDLHVRNLHIRSQSSKDTVTIEVDQAMATVDVPRFAARTFRLAHVRVQGAAFRYERQEVPGPPSEGTDPWRMEFDDIVVDGVREMQFADHHFAGEAVITAAGFAFVAKQFVEITDAAVDVARGDVRVGDAPMLANLHGHVDVTLRGVDATKLEDRELLRYFSASVLLDAEVRSLAFLDSYLQGAPWLKLTSADGALHVDAQIEGGEVQIGSAISVAMKDLTAMFRAFSITGDGLLDLGVAAGADGAPESRLAVQFGDFAIAEVGDEAAHATGIGFLVTANTSDVALDAPFDDLKVSLLLPESEIPDVRVYQAYLPSDIGLALKGGRASVHGKLEVSTVDNIGKGELYIVGKGVTATLDALTIAGDVTLRAVVPEARLDTGRYSLAGSQLKLTNVSVTDSVGYAGKDSKGWWATLDLPRGHARSGGEVFLDTDLSVRLRDTLPLLAVFAQNESLPGWTRGMLVVEDVSGQARVRLGEDVVYLPTFEVRGAKKFSLSLELRRQQLAWYGKLHARYGELSMGMQLLGDEKRIQLIQPRKWYDGLASLE